MGLNKSTPEGGHPRPYARAAFATERQRIECRFRPLGPVLPPPTFDDVRGCRRFGSKLGHGRGGHRDLLRQLLRSKKLQVEVSSRPRGACSATGEWILLDTGVQVCTHPLPVDGGSVAEDLNDCAGIDELSPAQRGGSPTGCPCRLTTKDRMSSSARMMRPLSLRSSRWMNCSLTRPR
jgi:hypothetical protein